jgi:hypothetical protein
MNKTNRLLLEILLYVIFIFLVVKLFTVVIWSVLVLFFIAMCVYTFISIRKLFKNKN